MTRGRTTTGRRGGSAPRMGPLPASWYPFVKLEAVPMNLDDRNFDDALAHAIATYHKEDDPGRVETHESEYGRERRWSSFEAECREFAAKERGGWAAVLRAVATAMSGQGEMF